MATLLENLLSKGELPTVQVNATVDNATIYKIGAVIGVVIVIGILLQIAILKTIKR